MKRLRFPIPDLPEGYERVADVARMYKVSRSFIYRWIKHRYIARKIIFGQCYIHIDSVRELLRVWQCPACIWRTKGPRGLMEHVEFAHASMEHLPHQPVCPCHGDYRAGRLRLHPNWECPEAGCRAKKVTYPTAKELVHHLKVHVAEYERRGIKELPNVGRPRKGPAVFRCRVASCKTIGIAGHGAARGLCAAHYQRFRRARIRQYAETLRELQARTRAPAPKGRKR